MIEIRKQNETSIIKNNGYENVWDAAKPVQTGKFVSLNVYVRKEQRMEKIKYLNIWIKTLLMKNSKKVKEQEMNNIENKYTKQNKKKIWSVRKEDTLVQK